MLSWLYVSALSIAGEGNRIWRAFDLGLEEGDDAGVTRIITLGGVPLGQQLALTGCQQWQPREPLVGIRSDTSDQGLEVACHTCDGGGVKEIAVILERGAQPFVSLGDLKREVILGRAVLGIKRPRRKTRQCQGASRGVLEDE